MNHYKKTSST